MVSTFSLMRGVVGTAALLAALHDFWGIAIFRTPIWIGALTLGLVAITDVPATVRQT